MAEKVSIITVSYNSENTIERTIRSVLTQSYRPLEYVIIDGDSKDDTVLIIQKYIPLLEKFGIEVNYQSEPDRGISEAFNKGIRKASGDIVGIINSDDQLAEDILYDIVRTFDEQTDVVCGDCLWIDKVHNINYVRKSHIKKLKKLKYEMVLMHPSCFVRKTTYEKYGVFDVDLKYAMDKDLMARIFQKGGTFQYIPKVIAIMQAGGVSDTDLKEVYAEGVQIAARNGVPKWKAQLRKKYKSLQAYCKER